MMPEKKTFAMAEVKAAESESPSGEFEVILSAETLDRDGEVIDKGAFDPLPESIPFHAFHDFNDPIGRAVPYYDNGVLKARGTFASTPRAQEIRTLVSEGVIGHTSVGFMAAVRKDADDENPHVTKGELLEGSFVSVPSNREAAVLMAKSFEEKAGARNSTKDSERLQTIHDLAVTNGAVCAGITRSYAPSLADSVIAQELPKGMAQPLDHGLLTGPTPKNPTTEAPVTPAEPAGKSPASNVVEATRIIARASLPA